MAQLRNRLAPYNVYWPSKDDLDRALADFATGHLSHKLGILDAVSGETAVGLGLPLDTFNSRNFTAIPVLTTAQPY